MHPLYGAAAIPGRGRPLSARLVLCMGRGASSPAGRSVQRWRTISFKWPGVTPRKTILLLFCFYPIRTSLFISFRELCAIVLCIHRLFVCCLKLQLFVMSFMGRVLNEGRCCDGERAQRDHDCGHADEPRERGGWSQAFLGSQGLPGLIKKSL